MTTLFDAILTLAREVLPTREGVATGGSTETLIDTGFVSSLGSWNGGTLFILSGTYAEYTRKITKHAGTTFTFTPAFVGAIVSGVRYALADQDIPLDVLKSCVNAALIEQGPWIAEDKTLLTVAGQEEYVLPDGVSNLLRVEVGNADETRWIVYHHWDEINGVLRLPYPYVWGASDYPIRLTFRQEAEELTEDSDDIPFGVSRHLLHWQATVNVCQWGLRIFGAEDKHGFSEELNKAHTMLQRTMPMQTPRSRTPRWADW